MTSHGSSGVGTRESRKQKWEDRAARMKRDVESRIARGMQGLRNNSSKLPSDSRNNSWELLSDSLYYDPVRNDLCRRCSEIPWSEVHRTLIKTAWYQDTFQLLEMTKTLEELRVSACSSCRILGSNLPIHDIRFLGRLPWSGNDGGNYLRFSDQDNKYWLPSSLSVMNKNNLSLSCATSYIDSDGYADTSELKESIRNCVSNHKQCRPQPCDTLKSLKVLDCHERTIVLAPESCQFVALSYVWGQPTVEYLEARPIDRPQFPTLPDILPRTVEDSIELTKILGHKYLWVDRYCIDQNNPDDQYHQINQMGAIYFSAQITLIAAAGTDAMFGLPGFGREFRYLESCPVTRDLCLVNATHSVTRSVSASTWYSRAWTLQEGYLSRRRLFLVEHGMTYICDEELQNEDLRGVSIATELAASLPSKTNPWDRANHMMRQFAGRRLTYDGDALNAIIGALGTLESVDHTEGVTIQRSNSSETSSIYMALNWYHDLPCSRRKGFPSWSPLGWRGQIDYLDYQTSISPECSLEVWYEGAFMHVSDVFGKLSERHRAHRPTEERFLRLTTTVVMLDFEYLEHEPGIPTGLYVKFPYASELELFILPFWDVDVIHQGSAQLPCAIAVRRRTLIQKNWRCEQESQILIMRQHSTHYERVGCFNLHWSHRNIYAREKQGRIFPMDFTYGNPLLEYGDGTYWKKNGEERTFLLG